ncbi:MAG: peptidase M28, partial [Acidobacteria bacterium]|nr:peptidase M28 [Acidobacteriota bacterium]
DRNPQQDRSVVRVFSEGVPVAASDQEIGMLRTIGGENDSTSRELARYVGEVSRSYGTALHPLLILRPDRYLRGGDHFSFNQQGFAAVRFTEYREDFHHQHQNVRTEGGMEYGDLPKFVDFDYVAHVAQLNAATLASLAAAPAPPGNVRLLTRRLENHSTLTWAPAAGASGYEIVWRKTSSSDWDQAEKVGDVNQVTLEIPKDNVIFAVRSVDRQGHRSLPVAASPEQ